MLFLEKCEPFLIPVGRILIGVFFFIAGVQKFLGIEGIAGYIASVGLPMGVPLAWIAAIFLVCVGGAMIIGYKVKYAALLLAAYTILVTLLFHGPHLWEVDVTAMGAFLKNLAVLGGLLFVAGHTSSAS